MSEKKSYDVIILGAGGAGMMCAIQAGRRGRRVLLLDHSERLGGKILISGGGRCNFTNLGAGPKNYVSQNPHFCKSALSRYPSENFIEMVRNHGIAFHEKKLGQLFCDVSAKDIVAMLKSECDQAHAQFQLGVQIQSVDKTDNGFQIRTHSGDFECRSLVVATGGLSIPKLGATGLGYDLAKQFGLKLTPRVPALDGFTFADAETNLFTGLSGVSLDCIISCPSADGIGFRENVLFTHSGLSGPAALQASLHWTTGDEIEINLLPDTPVLEWLLAKKREGSRGLVKNLLCELLPSRFATLFCELYFKIDLPLAQISDRSIEELARKLHAWRLVPKATVGYNKAEVTRGGVNTDELSSKTMEARKVPGLYFIGEVVDVTGWLGGYNFQWAWASGWAAGQVV